MPVAPVARPVGLTLIAEVLVKLGVQNALRKRLLQIVEQTVTRKYLVRVAAGQQPVQKFFLDCHAMILLLIIMASRTEFLTVPPGCAAP